MTGTDSKWTNTGSLFVGNAGSASLTVADGGAVVAANLNASLSDLSGDGTITATQGAVLDTDLVFDAAHGTAQSFSFGSGGSLNVNWSGGVLGAGYRQNGSLTIAEAANMTSSTGYLGMRAGFHRHGTGGGPRFQVDQHRRAVCWSVWQRHAHRRRWWRSGNQYALCLAQRFGGQWHDHRRQGGSPRCRHRDRFRPRQCRESLIWLGGMLTYIATGTVGAGYKQNGSLTIGPGMKVTASLFLGYQAGSTGTATITGSQVTGSGLNFVGFDGNGTLTLEAGGKLSDYMGHIGFGPGSTGTATITGTGSTWTNTKELYIGGRDLGSLAGGHGTLNIEAGGQVTNSTGYLGAAAGSVGTATVTGAGSKWTNSGALYVGYRSNGSLTIEDGGQVTSASGELASNSGTSATVTVTDAGSSWTNSGALYVGYRGDGSLTIEDGGQVNIQPVPSAIPADRHGAGDRCELQVDRTPARSMLETAQSPSPLAARWWPEN